MPCTKCDVGYNELTYFVNYFFWLIGVNSSSKWHPSTVALHVPWEGITPSKFNRFCSITNKCNIYFVHTFVFVICLDHAIQTNFIFREWEGASYRRIFFGYGFIYFRRIGIIPTKWNSCKVILVHFIYHERVTETIVENFAKDADEDDAVVYQHYGMVLLKTP